MVAEAELAEPLGGRPSPSAATLRRKVTERQAERDRHQAAVNRLQHDRVVAQVPRNLHMKPRGWRWPSHQAQRTRG